MIKVLIAEDQKLIQEALQIILSTYQDITLVGVASNGFEVLDIVKKNEPDVILMDIRMPEMDGVECTKLIKKQYPHIKIIILTTFDDNEYIFSAIKYGASGYLLKGVSSKELHEAVLTVANGGAMINPDIAMKVIQLFSEMASSSFSIQVNEQDLKELGKSDWQIIRLVSQGLSNREIAEKLCLSEGNIRNHVTNILSILQLKNRTQLAVWAVQSGMLSKIDS